MHCNAHKLDWVHSSAHPECPLCRAAKMETVDLAHKHDAIGKAHNERVPFRLIQMPCCMHMVCWVNSRLPTYCSECGAFVYDRIREKVLVSDMGATLRYSAKTP